jgi:MoxR-like ATPase
MFYPVFITGLSGNGKTLMVEQVCAVLKRECIRVNISIETDESDLLGGPTLVNGNVVNRDGPVLLAMKKGAVLLIDEVDRGSNKLMCLQGILEGKPYYNKKTGEVVHPASGFNVIATANTKGRGSEEGRYLSQILDDAFLERFPITVEQEYPDIKTERKILTPLIDDVEFVETLTKWADIVRQSFDQGATDEVISTRRLVHIAKAFSIFKDRKKAIELCVNRFDNETKLAFLDLYSKVEPFSVSGDYQNMKIESENNDDFPF